MRPVCLTTCPRGPAKMLLGRMFISSFRSGFFLFHIGMGGSSGRGACVCSSWAGAAEEVWYEGRVSGDSSLWRQEEYPQSGSRRVLWCLLITMKACLLTHTI